MRHFNLNFMYDFDILPLSKMIIDEMWIVNDNTEKSLNRFINHNSINDSLDSQNKNLMRLFLRSRKMQFEMNKI